VAGAKDVSVKDVRVEWWANELDLRRDKYLVKSDEEVERAILAAIAFDPRVHPFSIVPRARSGVVTLRGHVGSLKAMRAAEQIATDTVGVTSVDNQLEVTAEVPGSDAELEERIRAALARNPLIRASEIEVDVKAGVVTLDGTVTNAAEKAEAEDVAATIDGVTEVENELFVSRPFGISCSSYYQPYFPHVYCPGYAPSIPLRSDPEILADIRNEFFWSPFVDSDRVQVLVDDGRVTLTGQVDTHRERVEAVSNAFQGGAIAVNDELKLTPL
jgi:osmotically-inducible protein OsmY